jgi:hypothetical protein
VVLSVSGPINVVTGSDSFSFFMESESIILKEVAAEKWQQNASASNLLKRDSKGSRMDSASNLILIFHEIKISF